MFHSYSAIFTKLHMSRHNSGDSGIFRTLALPARIMLTNTCSSSQVLLITVQIYLKHFFIFVSKVEIQYFYLDDSISMITTAIIIACHTCKHALHLTHATHASTRHTLARHLSKHTTLASTLPTKARYPRHPR